tara:strand:- start:660 stop:1370 length:711 start_codon:yes stop_codon:yes gene_type:complete
MIKKPMVILAGGFGTRLQDVLDGNPKALANINGTPFLKILFLNWIKKGFNDFILSLHYGSELIIDFINKSKNTFLKNCKIRYVIEPKPMGTGGAIAYVLSKIENLENDFFVVNSDTWIEHGYSELNNVEGNTIAIVSVQNTSRFGTVELDLQKNIIKFSEKSHQNQEGFINAGVYKLNKSIFNEWDGLPFSLENDLFPKLVLKHKIKGQIIKTDFIDIGVPEDYNLFINQFNLSDL